MKGDDNEKNIAFYSKLVSKHGDDVKTLNWGSKESQENRFKILASYGDLNGASILDVGCGVGHFYTWLKDNYEGFEYTGVDITPAMITIAKEREPSGNFSVVDLLQETFPSDSYDFVFASGIFYLREDKPFEFMKDMVRKMFDISNNGVGFNTLSNWADNTESNEFYADPIEVIGFAKSLTRHLDFNHLYHPADFTIFLSK